MENQDIVQGGGGKAQVKIGEWVQKGWELYKDNFALSVVVGLLYLVLISVSSITYVAQLILYGPLSAGIFCFYFEIMKGRPAKIDNMFKGFQLFVPTMLAGLVITIFMGIGFVLCVIPGIIVGALYLFALPVAVEKNMPFWDAMEDSRKLVMTNLLEFVLFYLVTGLIVAAGALLCGIGVIFTFPLGVAIHSIAYSELYGIQS